MKKKLILWVAIIGPFLSIFFISTHVYLLFKEKYVEHAGIFQIKPGEGFAHINYGLYKQGYINNPRIFHYFTKYRDELNSFQAGTFEIPANSTMEEVLMILTHGTPISVKVTIPEGKNIYEIALLLEQKELVKKEDFLNLVKDPSLLEALGVKAASFEGYLFPDTYKFSPGTSTTEIIKMMVQEFKKKISHLDFSTSNLSPHEVIILASVVEKETGAKSERPTIAGVFTNRLRKKMRLQSDPTTIYGIYENYSGNLKKDDLLAMTPYNTYKIPALPIGPISNPSLEAITAVLKPENHEYLFFVSKNDGTHVFTKTYSEHSGAVDEFQKNRNNRTGKSWRQLKQ